MGKNPKKLIKALDTRKANLLYRTLPAESGGIDFVSNDYLGFSKLNLVSKKAKELFGKVLNNTGSTGSRLISGNSIFIEETESKIANFHKAESALIFNSGYDANLGLLSSVPLKNDLVISDEFIHASIYDGIRLSYAKHFKFKHNDLDSLKNLISRHAESFENIYIVVESIYSMDGDEAPLLDIISVIEEHDNVFLIVDEAHALGVFGDTGKGLSNELEIENKCFARIYTYGKAMGCHGAAVVGSKELIKYLINFARSFIYTTALSKHAVANINSAYELLIDSKMQSLLKENIQFFLQQTKDIPQFIESRSTIHCIVLGSNEGVDRVEKLMLANGVLCKAVKSPTVIEGKERIRFCIHLFNTKQEIVSLVACLKNSL